LWVGNAPHLLQLQRLHSNVRTAAYNSVFLFFFIHVMEKHR